MSSSPVHVNDAAAVDAVLEPSLALLNEAGVGPVAAAQPALDDPQQARFRPNFTSVLVVVTARSLPLEDPVHLRALSGRCQQLSCTLRGAELLARIRLELTRLHSITSESTPPGELSRRFFADRLQFLAADGPLCSAVPPSEVSWLLGHQELFEHVKWGRMLDDQHELVAGFNAVKALKWLLRTEEDGVRAVRFDWHDVAKLRRIMDMAWIGDNYLPMVLLSPTGLEQLAAATLPHQTLSEDVVWRLGPLCGKTNVLLQLGIGRKLPQYQELYGSQWLFPPGVLPSHPHFDDIAFVGHLLLQPEAADFDQESDLDAIVAAWQARVRPPAAAAAAAVGAAMDVE